MPRTGRPPLPDDQKRRPLYVLVAPETLARIQELAKDLDLSQSIVVDRAVAAFRPRQR